MGIQINKIEAIQFEIYIPIMPHRAREVQALVERILELAEGVTEFRNVKGIWGSEEESTIVYRFIIPVSQLRAELRPTLQTEVMRLQAILSLTSDNQDCIMYTETAVQMNIVR